MYDEIKERLLLIPEFLKEYRHLSIKHGPDQLLAKRQPIFKYVNMLSPLPYGWLNYSTVSKETAKKLEVYFDGTIGCRASDAAFQSWLARAEQKSEHKEAQHMSYEPQQLTPMKETTMQAPLIERKIFIQGQDIKTMTQNNLFSVISQLESEALRLDAISHKPKILVNQLAKIESDLVELIKVIDEAMEPSAVA